MLGILSIFVAYEIPYSLCKKDSFLPRARWAKLSLNPDFGGASGTVNPYMKPYKAL